MCGGVVRGWVEPEEWRAAPMRRRLHDVHHLALAVRVQRAARQRAAHALRDVTFYVIRLFISMDQYYDSGIRATPRERVASELLALCLKFFARHPLLHLPLSFLFSFPRLQLRCM